MTLQQLYYFVTACRYGNITRAAEYFSVSQPSVSNAIKNLENEFKVCLLRRNQAGFTLTEEGEEFKRLAESLLEHSESVSQVMHAFGKKRQLLRLGMPPMAGAALFPSIYSDFCKNHPDVDISTQEVGRDALLNALDDDSLDMAFVPHTDGFPSNYTAIPVKEFEMVCCLSKLHRLSDKDIIHPSDLADEPIVIFSKGFFQAERVYEFFSHSSIEPKVTHTSSQLSTVEEFISENIAVGFLFREVAEKNNDIVPVSLDPRVYTKISLVFKKDKYLREGMLQFVDYIRSL